jgi:hypothetical protein
MTLNPNDLDNLPAKPTTRPRQRRRAYWTPTLLEGLAGIGLAAAWLIGVLIVIRHEDVGFFLTIVYLLMALVGAAVTWLIVWPLIRTLTRD